MLTSMHGRQGRIITVMRYGEDDTAAGHIVLEGSFDGLT